MSTYERQVWEALHNHWERRSNRRGLPNWAGAAIDHVGEAASKTAHKVADGVPDAVAEPVRRVGDFVADKAARPVMHSVAALLELVDDWAVELNDPSGVEKLAKKQGIELDRFTDLRQQDLKICDRLLDRNSLKWRTAGALEGGAMGALALVPVAGIAASITADILVVQVLSVSIASRVAYSYGFDAKDPLEEEFIERLVKRAFIAQAAKAQPMVKAAQAAKAIEKRQRWSAKLLADHRTIAATKKLMEHLGGSGAKVSVQSVAKVVPFIGIVLGAGMNSAVLGSVAEDAKRYCQTRFLCEKYGLPLPVALAQADDEGLDASAVS
ncbi:EcsC family protein [Amnibacterium soli]